MGVGDLKLSLAPRWEDLEKHLQALVVITGAEACELRMGPATLAVWRDESDSNTPIRKMTLNLEPCGHYREKVEQLRNLLAGLFPDPMGMVAALSRSGPLSATDLAALQGAGRIEKMPAGKGE